MATSVKKKGNAKERAGTEGASGAANVQGAFVSAAHNTVWPYEAAHVHGGDEPTIFTAAANAIRGRASGVLSSDDAWARVASATRSRNAQETLPHSADWAAERAMHARLQTTAVLDERQQSTCSASAVPYDPSRVRDVLYEEWLDHVAVRRASPLQYPHHVIEMDAAGATGLEVSTPKGSPRHSFAVVAAVLHRLLATYLRRCNERLPSLREEEAMMRVPARLFTRLLGSALYNINFSGPPAERKDVAFEYPDVSDPATDHTDSTAAPLSEVEAEVARLRACRPEPPPRRYDAISIVSCADAAHINVCVGPHYYKLTVMNRREGRLRSAAALAADLEVLHAHHLGLLRHDPLPGASPAVRQDREKLDAMFAQLSCLPDGVAFDVRRRLRAASEVNAYSLDALEAGLCTLVLREAADLDTPAEAVKAAQWLHSVCTLQTSLAQPTRWSMRLQALVVPMEAGMEWAAAALQQPSPTTAQHTPTDDGATGPLDHLGGTAEASMPGGARATAPPHEFSTPVDAAGRVEHLELWLPEKHRVPLRPYAAPAWNRAAALQRLPLTQGSGATTLADFCVALLRVTAAWKRQGRLATGHGGSGVGAGNWPRIVVALQPPRGGAPSLMALDMPAVQHFFEALAAPPPLFAAETRRQVEAAAKAEVAALLNIGRHSTSTTRTALPGPPCTSWWAEGGKSGSGAGAGAGRRVDVCLSFAVVPRQAAASVAAATCPLPAISRVVSDVTLPSFLIVHCTAQQTAAEAHLRACRAALVDAAVGASTPFASAAVADFAAELTACIQQSR